MDYRRLPLEGLNNARDIGGYPIAGGGVTAFRKFIRCEAPRKLSASDIEFLKSYGVTLSIDFRGDGEISRHPSCLENIQGIEYRRCVTFDKQVAFASGSGGGEKAEKGAGENTGSSAGESAGKSSAKKAESNAGENAEKSTGEKAEKGAGENAEKGAGEKRPAMDAFVDWGEKYIEIADNSRDWIRDTLMTMAHADGAVLFNCATGKDRTGIISALLLGLAGVAECDILADYCVSELYLKEQYEELLAGFLEHWPDEKADINSPFFKTAPVNMETFLAHVNKTHNGVESFIKTCGVDSSGVAALREKLIAVS